MGLFDSIKGWIRSSKIKSLESSLQSRPTPALYLQLADAHKEAGNTQKAAQVLKLGAARFPSAPEIVKRQAEAERSEREHEKKRLVEKIQSHPNPILYARLAELYKADGEINKTIDTCQRGVKAFPKYGGTYLVLGQIYVEKKSWQEAVAQLEKSVELDKYNYLALKLLAQVYLELNRPAEAAQRLEDILYFAPGDEAILELLKKAKEIAGVRETTEAKTQQKSGDYQRSGMNKMPEGAGGKRNTVMMRNAAPAKAPVKEVSRDQAMSNGLLTIKGVAGVLGAILVDQYGLVIASELDPTLDESLAGALITNVYRTASNNSMKLNVGQFEESLIEGASGNIRIIQLDETILAVFAKPEVKMGLLDKTIHTFATSVLQQK